MGMFDGKVAIVTGGSRGIGAAISRGLAAEGASVVLNSSSRSSEAADKLVEEIRGKGGKAEAVEADLSDPAAVERLFETAEEKFGGLDILVNNAGVYEMAALEKTDVEHYERIFNVNVRACLLTSAEAARRMRDGGRIVNLSSGGARAASPNGSVYGASKASVEALTRGHSAELGARGITVNAVAPGLTETDMMKGNQWPQEQVDAMIKQTSLGRLGQPEDVADVVIFLCSHAGRWVTGQVIDANGGIRM